MQTKIQAADLATRSGVAVVIAAGHEPDVIVRVASGERIGTFFPATTSHPDARQRWILAETVRHSRIVVDEGAATALVHHGKSLLAAGIRDIGGEFERGQTVRIFTQDGREIARGLTQYRSSDLHLIAGLRSSQIVGVLGYDYGPEVVHRDDMVVLTG
jgi:glutamate 5-kinase